MSKIELKDITLDYTDQGNVYHALDGVTFSVEEGEFVSLIGSSGCGKSTTLSILAGLNNPQSGSFLIDGQETKRNRKRQRRGIPALFSLSMDVRKKKY